MQISTNNHDCEKLLLDAGAIDHDYD